MTPPLTKGEAAEAVLAHGSLRAAALSQGLSIWKLRKILGDDADELFLVSQTERAFLRAVAALTTKAKGRAHGPNALEIAAALGIKERGVRARIARARVRGFIASTRTGPGANGRHTLTTLGRKAARLPLLTTTKED